MARRRLEQVVLEVLWASPAGMPAQDVRAAVGEPRPAVTTVLTVLERLRAKGLVTRARQRRAFAYRATAAREQLVAAAMLAALQDSTDRALALSRFVDAVADDDLCALRRALDERAAHGGPDTAPAGQG